MLMLVFAAGICVHAADFNVTGTNLPSGNAYESYTAHITMNDGNDGYSFEFVSGLKPAGLTIHEDGTIDGTPTSSGFFKSIYIRISNVDGTSAVVKFSVLINPRPIKVNIIAPANAVYDGVTEYTATAQCYDAEDNLLEDLQPQLTYGIDRLSAAVNAGTYYINVSSPSGCMITEQTGDERLTVQKLSASLTVKDKTVSYDGNPHGMTAEDIVVSPPAAGYAVEYRKVGTSDYTTDEPVSSGKYNARVHTTNPNYETVYKEAVLIIAAQGVKFTVTKTTVDYDGKEHEVDVKTDIPDVGYTVSYTDKDGNTVSGKPVNAGTYGVVITLNDTNEYSIDEISEDTLTINKANILFSAENTVFDYDGNVKDPNITAKLVNGELVADSELYEISYKKEGEEVSSVLKKAGTYNVTISLKDENNYTVDESSVKTITIKSKTVNFTVTNNNVPYNGQPHKATFEPDIEIPEGTYTVSYKLGENDPEEAATAAGVYQIIITFTNKNYSLGTVDNATMTITSIVYMNLGNSPAAMIYKDANHAENDEWQNAAQEYFETNHKFGDAYIPEGCVKDITYPSVGTINFDTDKYTVIIQSIDNFEDVDPGLYANGSSIKGTLTPVENIDGLYEANYEYSGENFKRYVAVVSGRIGDISGDGYVNAADANYLDRLNEAANSVDKARIWDVNKDGILDKNDAVTIRNRFRTKLVSYYPWLNWTK